MMCLLSLLGTFAYNQKSDVVVSKVPAATIRVGTWESGDALDIWNGLITNFKTMYPQITISFEPVPDNYGTKLLTQIAANDAPDVFQVGDGDVRMFVERGGGGRPHQLREGQGRPARKSIPWFTIRRSSRPEWSTASLPS